MRTVGEIVEAVQEQRDATDEELRLTLLCLYYHAQMACKAPDEDRPVLEKFRSRENFERHFTVMKAEPDHYLGPRWTPGTAENLEGRRLAKRFLKHVERARKEKGSP